MRAIIIEEERFIEISELMEAKVAELADKYSHTRPADLTPDQWKAALAAAHRTLHFHFTRWAQDQGVSFVRK